MFRIFRSKVIKSLRFGSIINFGVSSVFFCCILAKLHTTRIFPRKLRHGYIHLRSIMKAIHSDILMVTVGLAVNFADAGQPRSSKVIFSVYSNLVNIKSSFCMRMYFPICNDR